MDIKWNKVVVVSQHTRLDVECSTLLSIDEVKALPRKVRSNGRWWWLRSPGMNQDHVVIVNGDGSIHYNGDYAYESCLFVRPALVITNLNESGVHVSDEIDIFGLRWTAITDHMVLANQPLCQMAFRENWRADDANNYEQSDVKKYLDDWFKKQMAEYTPGNSAEASQEYGQDGYWLDARDYPDKGASYGYGYGKCSVCGHVEWLYFGKRYCPHCGANLIDVSDSDTTTE